MVAISPPPSRLLIIEHDLGVSDLLRAFLTREGYEALVVASPQEALANLEEHTYHLVVTDLFRTGEREPFRSIEPLRDRAHPTPVAVMTGWKVEAEEVTRRGFACLVGKPFDLEDLLTSIAACLKGPFSPEQALQARGVQAYFAALGARDWDALVALCTDEVTYSLPGQSPFAGTIIGKAAFRAYTEETFRQFPAARFEEVLVYSRPFGLAARYRSCWELPEGGEVSVAGSVLFGFEGERIARIGIQLGEKQQRVLEAYSEPTRGEPSG
jgi:CheY-like chemotaxis protein